MNVNQLIDKIKTHPDNIDFAEVIEIIDASYSYIPTRFSNGIGDGKTINEAETNEGSCKIFAFGKLNNLDKKQTLACFGKYYREDVLKHPENDDHANIRNFMLHGWQGINFESEALHT